MGQRLCALMMGETTRSRVVVVARLAFLQTAAVGVTKIAVRQVQNHSSWGTFTTSMPFVLHFAESDASGGVSSVKEAGLWSAWL